MATGALGFWTDAGIYLKRKNLFTVTFVDPNIAYNFSPKLLSGELEAWSHHYDIVNRFTGEAIFVKGVKLPSLDIKTDDSRNFIGGPQKNNIPSVVDWTPITITMVDMHVGGHTSAKAQRAAAEDTKSARAARQAIAEIAKATSVMEFLQILVYYSLGGPRGSGVYNGSVAYNYGLMKRALGSIIITNNHPDGNPIEQWKLYNPWITKFECSDLIYGDDNPQEIQLSLDYLSAEYTAFDGNGTARQSIFK